MKKELGLLTDSELDLIMILTQRKNALKELYASISSMSENMHSNIIQDLIDTDTKIGLWWVETAKHHSWVYNPSDRWNVDFITKTVSLEINQNKEDE